MVIYDTTGVTTTNLDDQVTDYSVDSKALDFSGEEGFVWSFPKAQEYIGYYKNIPELKKAVDALATWTAGKGYEPDNMNDKIILEEIRGWGEDSFQAIMENMIIMKKVVGDAFAEIIRNEETGNLDNIKPISPERMRVITNKQGFILRYETLVKDKWRRLRTDQVLHLCNDRIGDEIHGVSVIEACKWVIDARNEAMETYKKIMKRSLALGVLYVDSDDSSKITDIKNKYKDAVNNGEVLVLPKELAEIQDAKVNVQDFVRWIQYLENFFYQAVGVPKIILGGAQEFTEASSKIGYLTFEPVYTREQTLLEQDLWNQLAIKIKFNRPASLGGVVQQEEQKNTGQTAVQPAEAEANITREE